MKGHDAARWNVHQGAGLWVAAGPRDFVAELEVAEACQLDCFPAPERVADFSEEGVDHVFSKCDFSAWTHSAVPL